mgnify:FL=1
MTQNNSICYTVVSLEIWRDVIMQKMKIKLEAINDVKEFVSAVTLCDYDVDLVSGRYSIDAKSIMGIFSLDLSRPVELQAHVDNCDDLVEKIKKFVVE